MILWRPAHLCPATHQVGRSGLLAQLDTADPRLRDTEPFGKLFSGKPGLGPHCAQRLPESPSLLRQLAERVHQVRLVLRMNSSYGTA